MNILEKIYNWNDLDIEAQHFILSSEAIPLKETSNHFEKLERALMDLMKCEFVLEQNKKEQVELEKKVVLAIRKFNFFNKFGIVKSMQINYRFFTNRNMDDKEAWLEEFSYPTCQKQYRNLGRLLLLG